MLIALCGCGFVMLLGICFIIAAFALGLSLDWPTYLAMAGSAMGSVGAAFVFTLLHAMKVANR
jgi:NhaP-type Na+/H+ and K+/H+ antiporter